MSEPPEKQPPPSTQPLLGVLPMALRVGDRLVDEIGEYEVIGRPYATAAGKTAHVRVRRVDNAAVVMVRTWGAHERVAVRRG